MAASAFGTEFDKLAPPLAEILDSAKNPAILLRTDSEFRRFRMLEPSLVSVLDHIDPDTAHVAYYVRADVADTPAALASFVCEINTRRPESNDIFGRIDLVITADAYRALGLAKLIVLTGMAQMMHALDSRLYSISCLAAHEAIERILLELGFDGERRERQAFRHLSIRLDDENRGAFRGDLMRRLTAALKVTKYRIRQRRDRA